MDQFESRSNEESQLYTTEYLGRLLLNSFKFSQGNQAIQRELFDFLAHNYQDHIDDERLTASIPDVAVKSAHILANRRIHKEIAHEDFTFSHYKAAAKDAIKEQVDRFRNSLDKARTQGVKLRAEYALNQIINYDHRHIVERNGRQRDLTATKHENEKLPISQGNSNYESHLVTYGFLGKNTGMPEYNAFFSWMMTDYEQYINIFHPITRNPGHRKDIEDVLEKHFQYNPHHIAAVPQHIVGIFIRVFGTERSEWTKHFRYSPEVL